MTIALACMVNTANAQSSGHGANAAHETYFVDSTGTTLYRKGVAVCHKHCGPIATRVYSGQAPTQSPLTATSLAATQVGAQPIALFSQPDTPLPRPASPNASPPVKKNEGLTKEEKALLLNAAAATAVTAYGIAFWDYFQTSPKAGSEGWFGRTTKHGGADKLGHLWSTYTLAHVFSYIYRRWDFDPEQANTLGALSSLGLQSLMEAGDAFSSGFGFSYEDALMNVAGAGAAYVLGKFPSLARKIDLRLEYIPEKFSDLKNDVLTNYENQRYILALKLDGFDELRDTYLSYLELQAGYFTRGYEDFKPDRPDNRTRSLYFGIGLNVSKLVRKLAGISVFDYVQAPYTTIGIDKNLD